MTANTPKHTPGPWRLGDGGRTIFGPDTGRLPPFVIAAVTSREDTKLAVRAPDLLAENERLLADNEQLARELRLTREGNPTFSELRSQIEAQAEQLAALRDAAANLFANLDGGYLEGEAGTQAHTNLRTALARTKEVK